MMDRFYRSLIFAFLGLIAMTITCSQMEESTYDPQFNVYGILYSWTPIHYIIVDRTYRMNEPSQPYVDDATVILFTAGYTDTLVFNNATGYYQSDHHFIQPATRYELCVAKEDLDTLRGITTIPGAFSILNASGDTLTLSDSIIFTASAGAAIYECSLLELLTYTEYSFWLRPDTLDTLVFSLDQHIYAIPSSTYEIYITACDSNYYEYYFEPSDSIFAAGVTGGVGLFASSWTVSKQFYIITQ